MEAEDSVGVAAAVMALGEGAEAVEDPGVAALVEDLEVQLPAIMEEDERFRLSPRLAFPFRCC